MNNDDQTTEEDRLVAIMKDTRFRLATAIGAVLALHACADAQQDCIQDKDRDLQVRACTDIIRGDASAAWAYHNRANAYEAKGDYDRAIADFTRVIELRPKFADGYNNLGVAYMKKGNYDRAIAEQTKALEIDSTTPEAFSYYFNRALAYPKAGKATQGLSDAERALQLSPNSAFALNARGQILEALGRRQEAIADFRQALAIDPNIEDSREGLRRLGATP